MITIVPHTALPAPSEETLQRLQKNHRLILPPEYLVFLGSRTAPSQLRRSCTFPAIQRWSSDSWELSTATQRFRWVNTMLASRKASAASELAAVSGNNSELVLSWPLRVFFPLNREQLDLEDQRGVGPNFAARGSRPVSQIGRHKNLPLRPHRHQL